MSINLEDHNLKEIEGLGQRGPMLSIVDLINANTLNIDMAAYSLYAIANGASFLTAARPGNAGKTTILSCLTNFLPPGIKLVTISDTSVITDGERLINEAGAGNLCFLCHEIGEATNIYGYIWNEYVGQLFRLMGSGCRFASCMHADTLPEMHDILVSEELGVSEEDFAQLGLILFINLKQLETGYRRRVATLHESGEGEKHNLLFSWKPESDTFSHNGAPALLKKVAKQRGHSVDQVAEELQQCKLFVESLMESGESDFRWVRKQVVGFYDKL